MLTKASVEHLVKFAVKDGINSVDGFLTWLSVRSVPATESWVMQNRAAVDVMITARCVRNGNSL